MVCKCFLAVVYHTVCVKKEVSMLEDHTERQTTDNSKTMCIDIRLTEEEPKMLKQRYP